MEIGEAGCPHIFVDRLKKACSHVASIEDIPYVMSYSGRGREYHLICEECAKDVALADLVPVCGNCFKWIEDEGYEAGIVGRPETLVRSTDLRFEHRDLPKLDLGGSTKLRGDYHGDAHAPR